MMNEWYDAWLRWVRMWPKYYQLSALLSMHGFTGTPASDAMWKEIDRLMRELEGYEESEKENRKAPDKAIK